MSYRFQDSETLAEKCEFSHLRVFNAPVKCMGSLEFYNVGWSRKLERMGSQAERSFDNIFYPTSIQYVSVLDGETDGDRYRPIPRLA